MGGRSKRRKSSSGTGSSAQGTRKPTRTRDPARIDGTASHSDLSERTAIGAPSSPSVRLPLAFTIDPEAWAQQVPLVDLHDTLRGIRYAAHWWFGPKPTQHQALERVVEAVPRIGEFIALDQVFARAHGSYRLVETFPELKIAYTAIAAIVGASKASKDERAEAWLLSCARNAGADIDIEAATYLARLKKLPSTVVDDIARAWRAAILRDISRSRSSDSISEQAATGTLTLLQAAEILRAPLSLHHGRFIGAELGQEGMVDAAILRAIESLDLGEFEPWGRALLEELSDGPEGFEHSAHGVWLFSMLRSDYSLRHANAEGVRTWMRAFAKGPHDRARPWRMFVGPGYEDSSLIAAQFAFASTRIAGGRPSARRDAAVQVLLGTQAVAGYWSNLPLKDSKEQVRHPVYTTCVAVHALALVKPTGWQRACEKAVQWLTLQQDPFGCWSEKGGPDSYLTVLVLDSLLLASGESPATFDPRQQLVPSPDEDSATVAAKAQRLGPQPRILKFLGGGTEADVYLVEDRFKRQVAAKVFMESKRIPEHIYAHAIGLARVPHEAVVTLYSIEDVLDTDGNLVPAILMERLEGEELEVRLQRQISIQELRSWGTTLLDVFAAMHEIGHIHRDVHSGNFFITNRGLRMYDVLNSPTSQDCSPQALAAMKTANARQVCALLLAMFDKVRDSSQVRAARGLLAPGASQATLTLADVRKAFGDAMEMLLAKR